MINTGTNTAFIEAQQYSAFILRNLHDGLIPANMFRNVSDFGHGTVIDIKTLGEVTLQEIAEEEAFTYNPIESGSIQLSITDYPADAYYITDEMRQDGTQIEALLAARASEGTRKLQNHIETRYFEVLNAGQTPADANAINGFSHRFYASGGNMTLTENDLIDMRLAFDKANVPMGGRVAIVDSTVAAQLAKTALLVNNMDAVGEAYSLAKDGFDREHQFVTMLHGWQIWTSNRLPVVEGETLSLFDGTGSQAVTGHANLFFSTVDDNTKPGMFAWRLMPKTETDRDMDKRRDKFSTAARFGLGVQRLDTLGVIVTDLTATAAA